MEEFNDMPTYELWIKEFLVEREYKELDFAMLYTACFHHGTDGHNRLMLISKLFDIATHLWAVSTDEQKDMLREKLSEAG